MKPKYVRPCGHLTSDNLQEDKYCSNCLGKNRPGKTGKTLQLGQIIKEVIRTGEVYRKHHQGHHPVKCIGGCDPKECGQDAFTQALRDYQDHQDAGQGDLFQSEGDLEGQGDA